MANVSIAGYTQTPPHHPPSQPRCAAAPHTALRGLTKRPRVLTHPSAAPHIPVARASSAKSLARLSPFCVPAFHVPTRYERTAQLRSCTAGSSVTGTPAVAASPGFNASAIKAHASQAHRRSVARAQSRRGLVARCIADLRAPRPHPSDGGTVAGICGSAREASCGQHGSRLAGQQGLRRGARHDGGELT